LERKPKIKMPKDVGRVVDINKEIVEGKKGEPS
jgi:hypothetical protein